MITTIIAGRPRILDDLDKQAELLAELREGAALAEAAEHVGCSAQTVRRHARRNPQFGRMVRQAEQAGALEPLEAMRRAVNSNWRAAAWLLERTQPERFARTAPDTLRLADVDDALSELFDELAVILGEECDAVSAERIHNRIEELQARRLSALRASAA